MYLIRFRFSVFFVCCVLVCVPTLKKKEIRTRRKRRRRKPYEIKKWYFVLIWLVRMFFFVFRSAAKSTKHIETLILLHVAMRSFTHFRFSSFFFFSISSCDDESDECYNSSVWTIIQRLWDDKGESRHVEQTKQKTLKSIDDKNSFGMFSFLCSSIELSGIAFCVYFINAILSIATREYIQFQLLHLNILKFRWDDSFGW